MDTRSPSGGGGALAFLKSCKHYIDRYKCINPQLNVAEMVLSSLFMHDVPSLILKLTNILCYLSIKK